MIDSISTTELVLGEWGAPLEVIDNHAGAIFERNATEGAELMRRVGRMLVREGRPDLWQEAYRDYLAVMGWSDDHPYHDGDETRFLHGSKDWPE